MSKGELIRLEAVTWRKISHGLFDYDNKNLTSLHSKVRGDSQVFIRVGDGIKTFSSFFNAIEFKQKEIRTAQKVLRNDYISFLFWIIKDGNSLRVYSYNQLQIILNLFPGHKEISSVDSNLQQVFKGWESIDQAKEELLTIEVEDFSKDIWKVSKNLNWKRSIKHLKIESKDIEIKEGNIIKMGRLKLKVKKIQLSLQRNRNEQVNNMYDSEINDEIFDRPIDHNQDIILVDKEKVKVRKFERKEYINIKENEEIAPWRIWLSNVMDDSMNPLVNPWDWKGTQGLIHINCLKAWMTSKRAHKVFNQYSEMYTWKTINCELWKMPYPFKVCFNGIKVSLLEYDEPESKYMAFETFMKEGANKSTSKSIYILHITDIDRYKYGRSNDVELHLEEISVSRTHGEIILINNKVMMKDLRSKFGTQVLSKSSNSLSRIDSTQNIFQIGRTWLMISYHSTQNIKWYLCWLWGKPKDTTDDVKEIEYNQNENHFLNK